MIAFSPDKKSYIFDRGYCHHKVNQIGQKSKLNLSSCLQQKHLTISLPKIKLNFNNNRTPPKKKSFHNRRYSQVSQILDNPEFDQLQRQKIEKSQFLSKKIKQMKQMQLMQRNRLKLIRFQNQTKQSSVMNDFHSPKTNGGFSRSKTGGIYYK